ncbi:zinc-dependent metalloprotease [bacterium]|nr:zinc-dependent metalloprotease [bacterium]
MRILSFLICLFIACTAHSEQVPGIAEKTSGAQKFPGFFPFYWHSHSGKIWLEIDKLETEFLYVHWLPAGLGSNDVGLDRGKLGDTRVVKFIRSGPKILLVQPNYSFRALTENAAETKTVRESFAESVLWGFEVAAEDKNKVLVDATSFYLQDVFDVISALKENKQGEFKLEASRSAFYMDGTKNFPRNTEVEVTLTFTSNDPGEFVRDVTPSPKSITVREHHSFVEAPEPGYEPRKFDPRAGFYGIRFMDFSTPIGEPIWKQWIARHRLKKKNPGTNSEAEEPIIYYIDSGAPEPVRTALLEGASWWNQAFETAGYKNAFQVKVLPEGADPLDVRYNVIQWVHRLTRGWSYGATVVDPRTGEIIKGHVSLGSQRVRQDYMIAEGLLAPYEGENVPPEMLEMALARIRQLSAHEVGHTLGLTHNFAASMSDRASVMDYPHPLIKIRTDGSFDLSDAYAKGIGEWDKVAIRYGYSDASDAKTLDQILQDATARGLLFIVDEDARPDGGAHPQAHLWDNGKDAVQELKHIVKVRELALSRFSENTIRKGIPLSNLEEVLVPIYLFHRYQIINVSKLIGGLDYSYTLRGDNQKGPRPVPAAMQVNALQSLLSLLQPDALAVPDPVLKLIPPRAYGYPRWRETFRVRTGLTFDALAPPESAANMILYVILHPERAARLVEMHSLDSQLPGFSDVVDKLLAATWKAQQENGYHGEIRRVVNMLALYSLMNLTANDKTASQVRAISYQKLDQLKDWLKAQLKASASQEVNAHYQFALSEIIRFQENPKEIHLTPPLEPPPGAPIGCW